MIKKNIDVSLGGKESRPIAMLVQLASQFKSKIEIRQDNKVVNAKSIMGMMSLSVCGGDKVIVATEGIDEEAAADAMEAYLSKQ